MTILMVLAMIATAVAVLPAGTSAAGAYTVTGTIRDAVTDNLVTGVTVTITNDSMPFTKEITPASGQYTTYLDQRADYNMTFEKEGYKTKLIQLLNSTFDDVNMTAKVGLTLIEPLPLLEGRVLDMNDMPLDDVEVTIMNGTTKVEIDQVQTGIDGIFSLYVDAPLVDIEYRKAGYYANELLDVQVEDTGTTDVGDVYLEMIMPTPTIKVWGRVFDDVTSALLPNALVAISTGDDQWITARTNANGSYEMLAYPGNFQVKASKQGYYTDLSDDWLNVPSNKVAVKRDIRLNPTPALDRTLTGTVTPLPPGQEATVSLYSTDLDNQWQTSTTTTGGAYTIDYYSGVDFKLVVEADDFFTYVHGTDINGGVPAVVDPVLTPIVQPHTLEGFVIDQEMQQVIPGATVTLYDTTRLYVNTTSSGADGHYKFMAHAGAAFVLVVNAEGFQSEAVDVAALTQDEFQDVELVPSPKDVTLTVFNFENWMNITVDVNQTIVVDNISRRGDMDRKFGMGDLGLEPNDWDLQMAPDDEEVEAWIEYLENKGVEQRDTKNLLTLDNLHYELVDDSYDVISIEGAAGQVTGSNSTIFINSTYKYTLVGELDDEDATSFFLVLNATYETETADYVYDMYLPLAPKMYEMTSYMTETTNVEVTGYNDPLTVDTMMFNDVTETVSMTIERSMEGEAKAKIVDGLFYALNTTFDNYTVIVRMGAAGDGVNTTVTFSAEDSVDEIGDITKANFTWNFGDGNTGWGMQSTHNYSTGGDRTVTLTITETGGNVTTRAISVMVDNAVPTARITVDDSDDNVTYASGTLTVNEDLDLTFSGLAFSDAEGSPQFAGAGESVDHITGSDGAGVIEKWYWSWGEEGVSNETVTTEGSNNITHTYEDPGIYSLLMNVTDVVGHVSADAIWTVRVLDITPPTPDILIKNETGAVVTECIENKIFTFNASNSQDNADEAEDMEYEWDFDSDGTIDRIGFEVNWTFAEVGDYNVTLIGNDTAGNSKNFTQVVYVSLGNRPNLFMLFGTMDFGQGPGIPGEGSVGKSVTISVNITNNGQVAADNVEVTFYIRNADGTDTEIGTSTTDSIAIDGNHTATITWKPGKKGEYTVWANCSTPGEHQSQYGDNKIDNFDVQKVNIAEAAWVMPAIIGAVIAVIVVVFFGVRYFMGSRMEVDEGKSGKRKKR